MAGSDFDFTSPAPIGPRLASSDPQISGKKGIDHNFVIDGTPGRLRIAARLRDPQTGHQLEVWTTQPGMQVYTANSVRPQVALAKSYVPHGAISFQTQHYPDSPNHANFPSTELVPGKTFHEVTEFRFSCRERRFRRLGQSAPDRGAPDRCSGVEDAGRDKAVTSASSLRRPTIVQRRDIILPFQCPPVKWP